MNAIAFLIGIALPAFNGWLVLRLLEGRTRVLFAIERIVLGCVLGLTLMMLLTFTAHSTTAMPINRFGFFAVHVACTVLFGALNMFFLKQLPPSPAPLPSAPLPRFVKIIFLLLGLWTLVKISATAVTFLLLTPTYLDDTLDNWNLRGKVYFVDQALTLVMPAEDPLTSPMGVSSYPPPVPLAKAWLASIAGEWSDALVNSIHIVWYLAAAALVFFALRRKTSLGWALTGTYVLTSIPLYLMHGTNPYGDAFVSVHVLIAATTLFYAVTADNETERLSFFRIAALASALLSFTKNEGLLVYLPPLLLILCIALFLFWKRQTMSHKHIFEVLLWFAGLLVALGLPWLMFKWSNGLTFGNAKPFTSLGFAWQPLVLFSITVNTLFEGNWVFLFPLLIALLILRFRNAFKEYIVLTAFFLIVYIGQAMLFLFTSLSHEALKQTGYARGIIHLTPVIVLLTTLLLAKGARPFINAFIALAKEKKMQAE